jgi:hypothetical protein
MERLGGALGLNDETFDVDGGSAVAGIAPFVVAIGW